MKVIGKALANAIYSFADGWDEGKRLNNLAKVKDDMINDIAFNSKYDWLQQWYFDRRGTKGKVFNTNEEALSFHKKYFDKLDKSDSFISSAAINSHMEKE
tara:strand:+ start:1774 stop:2073 length:300 start_codon:yes stop_codon:yes gene_type:complete